MSRRIQSPDTSADTELIKLLSRDSPQSFVMTAGAGSGKTTSLIKALAHVLNSHRDLLRRNGQQIACVTYTEVAVREILEDVGRSPLLHVSTLHSFLWNVVRPFQRDLAREVRAMLIDRSQRGGRNMERIASDLASLDYVKRFTYQAGARYPEGILGHPDIIALAPSMIKNNSLLAQIVGQRFPYIFVDESQDTYGSVVEALLRVAEEGEGGTSVGFFGDPMQMIYTTGVGSIDAPSDWPRVAKPENFRCPQRVLSVINNIRAPVDGLVQTGGRTKEINGVRVPVEGNAHLVVVPADRDKLECQKLVQRWLAARTHDSKWDSGEVKVLVIEHRNAAERLGFPVLHSAFTDDAPSGLSSGYREGTAPPLTSFLQYLLPLCEAFRADRKSEVVRLLRLNSGILRPVDESEAGPVEMLCNAKTAVRRLCELLDENEDALVSDVVELVHYSGLATLDDRLLKAWEASRNEGDVDSQDRETLSLMRFLQVSTRELWGYRSYIEGLSAYSTHQGVKGAEFERVIVILDDGGSRHFQFSYDKLFELKELSRTDQRNLSDGRDSVLDRTRRLLYVCCSRATVGLLVILYVNNVEVACEKVCESGIFPSGSVFSLSNVEQELTCN